MPTPVEIYVSTDRSIRFEQVVTEAQYFLPSAKIFLLPLILFTDINSSKFSLKKYTQQTLSSWPQSWFLQLRYEANLHLQLQHLLNQLPPPPTPTYTHTTHQPQHPASASSHLLRKSQAVCLCWETFPVLFPPRVCWETFKKTFRRGRDKRGLH